MSSGRKLTGHSPSVQPVQALVDAPQSREPINDPLQESIDLHSGGATSSAPATHPFNNEFNPRSLTPNHVPLTRLVLNYPNHPGQLEVPISSDGHTTVIHLDEHTDARITFRDPTNIEDILDIYKHDEKRKKSSQISIIAQSKNVVLSFLYDGFIIVASIITALPTMINAGLTGFGITASQVSIEVWNKASWLRRAWGSLLIFSTGTANFTLARSSFPQAFAQLRDGKKWKENPIRSGVAAFLATAGAASLFVVAKQTLAFNLKLAWFMATSGFPINAATRLISANNAINRLLQYVDPKISLQKRYFDKVKKLKQQFLTKLDKSLHKTLRKLEVQAESNPNVASTLKKNPDRFYGLLLVAMDKKLSRMTQKYEKVKPKSASVSELEPLANNLEIDEDDELTQPEVEKVDNILCEDIFTRANLLSTAMFTFSTMLGITFGATSFIVFEPKGESAVNIIYPNATASMDKFERLAIGSPAGFASALLYFLCAFDILLLLLTAFKVALNSKNPTRNLMLLASVVTIILLSGANMFNVANGTAHDPKTLFAEWLKNIQLLFACLGGLGGALVNGKSAFMEHFLNPVKLDFSDEESIAKPLVQVNEIPSINTNKGIDNKPGDEFWTYVQTRSFFAKQHGILDESKPNLERNRSTTFTI